jgi:hypothetical protein
VDGVEPAPKIEVRGAGGKVPVSGGTSARPQGSWPPMNRSSSVSISLPAELTPDMTLDALSHLPGRVLLETGRGVGRTLVSAAPCVELRWSEGEVEVRGGRAPGAGVGPPSWGLPDSVTAAGSGRGAWRALPGVRDPFSVLSRGLDGGSRTRSVPEDRPGGADGSSDSPSPVRWTRRRSGGGGSGTSATKWGIFWKPFPHLHAGKRETFPLSGSVPTTGRSSGRGPALRVWWVDPSPGRCATWWIGAWRSSLARRRRKRGWRLWSDT